MHKKTKGTIAELHVCADLIKQGWHILLPYGENQRYDVVAEKEGRFLRIQVKYVTPKDGRLYVNCQSSNNWSVEPYTSAQIDVIAAFNPQDHRVYYVPVREICKTKMALRLEPAKNGQQKKIRYAKDFGEFPGFVKEANLFSYSSPRTMERSCGAGTQAAKGDRL
ncbi:MAG: group I intron-associated PD-(D/E)XK endonuclease [Candidatus Omnitrophota bacterium]|nr:group I intron-associated PD-(D/E)XK endonuclease [Candidatus Omnitrophota bacterium]